MKFNEMHEEFISAILELVGRQWEDGAELAISSITLIPGCPFTARYTHKIAITDHPILLDRPHLYPRVEAGTYILGYTYKGGRTLIPKEELGSLIEGGEVCLEKWRWDWGKDEGWIIANQKFAERYGYDRT